MVFIDYKTVLLQALITGEGYAMDLIERVSDRTGGEFQLSQGRVSSALWELENNGLLRSWIGEPTPGRAGRPRRYYKMTAEGRRVAAAQGVVVVGLFLH